MIEKLQWVDNVKKEETIKKVRKRDEFHAKEEINEIASQMYLKLYN